MGGRALPRLDQPKPATGQGLRRLYRLRRGLSLRCLRHAPHSTLGAVSMSFESDSKRYATRRARSLWAHHDVDALRSVSVAIRVGESFGIVGESGSGKSTLARIMIGATPATSGDL